MTSATLPLDANSLPDEELSLPALSCELALQQRPNRLLRRVVNALEQKRQDRGLGWSQAWSQYGLKVFRAHVQDREHDAGYFAPLVPLLAELLPCAPISYQGFAADLIADPTLMALTFYHNHDADDGQYEGLTLSLGRAAATNLSKRDRLDVILEDRRVAGRVDGRVDRLRVYIRPWSEYSLTKKYFALELSALTPESRAPAQGLYESCVRYYHDWKRDDSRQWTHWSARYVDYFSPRTFIPIGSSFS